jgi:hypothetical protein
MGTSKGYIAPTKGEWTKSKRAVTKMINGSVSEELPNVIRKYATAVSNDPDFANIFSKSVSNLLGISRAIRVNGLENALDEYDKAYLIEKSAKEIWNELFDEYSSGGSTKEEALSNDALSKAINNLNIESLDDLVNYNQESLLKELLSCFACIFFAFIYEEQISKAKTPQQTNIILKEVERYIRSIIFENVDITQLKDSDFINISNSETVKNVIEDAYNTMKNYYGE